MSRAAGLFAAAALAAALIAFALHWVAPSYDDLYSLSWGKQLAEGHRLQLDRPFAPLAHPLPIMVGALLSTLGPRGSYEAMAFLCAASLALALFGVYRLTLALVAEGAAARAAGIFAVVLVLLGERFDFFAIAGTIDVPFTGLVLLAVAAAIERRRLAPLWLLLVAGLLRPESLFLAAAWCAWLAWSGMRGRRLAAAVALAAAPAALWIAFAAVATGQPFVLLEGNPAGGSLTAAGFSSPPNVAYSSDVPGALNAVLDGIRSILGDELGVVVLISLAGLAWRARRGGIRAEPGAWALASAIMLIAASVLYTLLGAVFTDRYALAAALVGLCGAAAFVWDRPSRSAAVASGILVAAILTTVIGGPVAPTLPGVRAQLSFGASQRSEQRSLYRLAGMSKVQDAVTGCPALYIGGAGHAQLVLFAKPLVADALGFGPQRVAIAKDPPGGPGASSFVRLDDGERPPAGATRDGNWLFRSACLPGS